MKKTLVAMAVLAASGASFAQVTMTGNFEYHYRADSFSGTGAPGDHSGMGVDSSELYFNAVEDIGGGTKATMNMGIGGLDRSSESGTGAFSLNNCCGNSTYGMDASLAISTASMGTFTVKTARGADYLSGGVAGVAGYGLDGWIFDSRSVRDSIGYSIPVGPVKLSFSHAEPNQVAANTAAAGYDFGEGFGATGSSAQRKDTIGVNYAAGALVVDAGYASYDNKPTNGKTDYLYDLSASYDFGAAKLGGGLESRAYVGGGTRVDYLVGVSVPVGAVTLGLQFASRALKSSQTGVGDTTANSTALTANYALSKRTYLAANYAREDNTNAANANAAAGIVGDQIAMTRAQILIGHNF
jgi:predicted porin